jgi:hypothetical protein
MTNAFVPDEIGKLNYYMTCGLASILLDTFFTAVVFVLQDRNTFHRFDKFNAKYNPIGESR